MLDPKDFEALDRPKITDMLFYPRPQWSPAPPGAYDHMVEVGSDVSVSCRFYLSGRNAPTILFFHGNGEVTADYDSIAPIYLQLGINLFVADYRGYGASGGTPSYTSMLADADVIHGYLTEVLESDGFSGRLFVMGRSLGAASALILAANYPEGIAGLVLESGAANPHRLLSRLGADADRDELARIEAARSAILQGVKVPLLVIHGEMDALIPLEDAQRLHEEVAAPQKDLVVIPDAGHNDIMSVGIDLYFWAIEEFVLGLAS